MAPPTPSSPEAATAAEEDDYLTMPLPSPSTTTNPSSKHRYKPETLTEKKKRLAREREIKAHPKSKAELAVEAKRKREQGLKRNILLGDKEGGEGDGDGGKMNNKGAAMMAKLGYVPGMPLGKALPVPVKNGDQQDGDGDSEVIRDTRLLEPIGISEREGRGGIGADAERKRKIREEFERVEQSEKRVKVEVEGYRERQAREREEGRREGLLRGRWGVAERLDEEDGDEEGRDVAGEMVRVNKGRKRRRLQDINVLWRGLVKQRELAERDRRMRYDLHQSLSTRVDYNDPEEDREDRLALGKTETEEVDAEELDGEDQELQEFESLEVGERLERLVMYLRERWRYCFWCKHRYGPEDEDGDGGLEGCPGTREEDHD